MDTLQTKICAHINEHIDDYMGLVKKLYDHPEIGFEEFETQKVLVDYLKSIGFKTKAGVVCQTDFVAEYQSSKAGPVIAFMCEYDALPEVGHGCGHNLIAGIGIAAGAALKAVIDDIGGTVRVIGTPGEENMGGKVHMASAGIFDDVDAALMVHPGTKNGLGSKSNAINPVRFEFFGKNAHGCHPQVGRSALDCAVLTYVNINMLRQMMEPNTYIHGVITEGGTAANVIPAYACLDYYFRAPTMKYVLEVTERATKIAQSMAVANECECKVSIYECPYEDTLINYTLADILKGHYEALGVEEIQPVEEVGAGSTDVGATSYRCPTLQGNIKIAPDSVNGHSKEMACATISEAGKEGLIKASSGIALVAYDLITKPELLEKVKQEFKEATVA